MSSTGSTGQEISKPVLAMALLVIALAVGMTVFDGTVRTVVMAVAGLGIVVSAGFAGAALKRAKQ
ncbi:hypothetical protein [Streptomyces sp. NPDC051561]|uniref:hypothetical protein n=1 Tax=Streptomyces sp. NPDC051561 TaxID=3365658 RepID=UPI00379A8957